MTGAQIALPPGLAAFGGDPALGSDPLATAHQPLPPDCLGFSHGRAAMSWLIERRGPVRSALVSAYTCPVVPDLLAARGLTLAFVDVGGDADRWVAQARSLPAPCLVVVPAFLGHAPDPDPYSLAERLGDAALVLIDAAQSAFAHLDITPPAGGAVLSAPRKGTALPDGAVLRLAEVSAAERAAVASLPKALGPAALRLAARAMAIGRGPQTEPEMLELIERSESTWPETPHRISEYSSHVLGWLDPKAHALIRWRNWQSLAAALSDRVEIVTRPGGVPFNLSILAEERPALLARLRAERVFATALWPTARHDPAHHPLAARLAGQLVGLPIDQRYDEADMILLSERVVRCLRP
jgi:hypothetical protein